MWCCCIEKPEQEVVMKRIVVMGLTLSICLTAGPSFGGHTDDTYVIPVAAKAKGKAGSVWRTEVCVYHQGSEPVHLVVGFFDTSADEAIGATWTVPAGTRCIPDIIGAVLSAIGDSRESYLGWGMIFTDEQHYSSEVVLPRFGAAVRINNQTVNGTYGQEVPMVTQDSDVYFADLVFGLAAGARNWGKPGESGFRTNIGVTNMSDEPETIAVEVYANNQERRVWEDTRSLAPGEIQQFAIPESVTVNDGTVVLSGRGCGYISVVDNRTGDAIFRPTQQHEEFYGWGPGEIEYHPPDLSELKARIQSAAAHADISAAADEPS
jgi:hypothetical protein